MFKQYLANPCRATPVLPAVFIGTPKLQRVNSFSVWMLYKDTLVDFLFPFFKNLNAAKGRTKLRFFACVASCSIISYRCSDSFRSYTARRVWFGWLQLTTTNRAKIPQSCFSALNMVGRARWWSLALLSRLSKTIAFLNWHSLENSRAALEMTNRKRTLALIFIRHKSGDWIGWLLLCNWSLKLNSEARLLMNLQHHIHLRSDGW